MRTKLQSVVVGVVIVAGAVGIATPAAAVSPPSGGGALPGLCRSAGSDVTYSDATACVFIDATARATFVNSVQGTTWGKLCDALYGGTVTYESAAEGPNIRCLLS
jgi:hypothetical protein